MKVNVNQHINGLKKKNYIISTHGEKHGQNLSPVYGKTSQQSRNRGRDFLTVVKNSYRIQYHTEWGKIECFPPKTGTREGGSLSSLLCNIAMKFSPVQ